MACWRIRLWFFVTVCINKVVLNVCQAGNGGDRQGHTSMNYSNDYMRENSIGGKPRQETGNQKPSSFTCERPRGRALHRRGTTPRFFLVLQMFAAPCTHMRKLRRVTTYDRDGAKPLEATILHKGSNGAKIKVQAENDWRLLGGVSACWIRERLSLSPDVQNANITTAEVQSMRKTDVFTGRKKHFHKYR